MLSDGALRGLKPAATTYKVADRDGMYVTVSPRGTITFRLDYRLNGRRETLTIGRYGAKNGVSLLMARERCLEARRAIAEGQSPCQEKQREKRRLSEAPRGIDASVRRLRAACSFGGHGQFRTRQRCAASGNHRSSHRDRPVRQALACRHRSAGRTPAALKSRTRRSGDRSSPEILKKFRARV